MKQIGWIFLGWLVLLGTAYGEGVQKERLSPDTLVQRGERLHVEVEQIWKKLKHSNTLQPKNDITETLVKYIPIGTSINDAEIILRSAGFSIWPHENSDKYNVDLGAGMYIEQTGSYSADVTISIFSKNHIESRNIVGRIAGTLSYTTH